MTDAAVLLGINLAVAKGAALLDEKRPAWFKTIDLELLDMENFEHCIIGQVAGTFASTGFHNELNDLDLHGNQAFDYGFDMPTYQSQWAHLQDRWYQAIVERRQNSEDTHAGA